MPARAARPSATCVSASRPTTSPALTALAAEIKPLLDDGVDVYAYFRHEEEPTAPLYAERLLALLGE